jgi:hypothetical protein
VAHPKPAHHRAWLRKRSLLATDGSSIAALRCGLVASCEARLAGLPAVVHIVGVMSLLDKMRAEREANAAKATARLSRFLGQSSDATTRDNAQLSHNDNHGRHVATADENQKLSHNVHNSAQPVTADKNPKLSHSGHNGAQPETTTNATRLPQNLQSRDGKRLASLLDQYRRGRGCSQQRSKWSN